MMKKLFAVILLCMASVAGVAGAAGVITPHWSGAIIDNLVVKSSPYVDVRAYGASTAGTAAANTAAIQAAVDAMGSSGGTILFPGLFTTDDTITISNHRVNLVGIGTYISGINFVPTSGGKPAIIFQQSTAIPIVQNSISDMSIRSSDTTYQKIGLKLVDISEFRLHNVAINPMNSSDNASVGIQTFGRDTSSFIDLEISSDIPFQVSKNPNHANIDFDVMNIHNSYFIANANNPSMLVDDNVTLSSMVIDGANIWASGDYGFYYNDTLSTGNRYNNKITNLRCERYTTSAGYCIYHVSNGVTVGLEISNILSGSQNGIYLRNAENVTITNPTHIGTDNNVALNVDTTVYNVDLRNAWYNTGTQILTGDLVGTNILQRPTGTSHGIWSLSSSNNSSSGDITNGGFDNTTSGWAPDSNTTIASTTGGQSGNGMTITRVGGTYQLAYQYVNLTVGDAYRVTGYAKSGTSGDETATITIGDAGGNIATASVTTSATWQQITVDFVARYVSNSIALIKSSATAGTMLWDTIAIANRTVKPVAVPGSSTAACSPDQVSYDTSYYYACVADNTWKRVAWDNTY